MPDRTRPFEAETKTFSEGYLALPVLQSVFCRKTFFRRRFCQTIAVGVVFLSVLVGISLLRPALAADVPWDEWEPEAQWTTCTGETPPPWCSTWRRLMEQGRPQIITDQGPEWQRVSFERNLALCSVVLLPPSWCEDWKRFMFGVMKGPGYAAALAAYRVTEAAKAERAAFEKARQQAWTTLALRIGNRRPQPGDFEIIEKRALDGDLDALELFAWMHVFGVGLPHPDYGRAYELYAEAILAGRKALQPNLDRLWPRLTGAERERVLERFGRPKPPAASPYLTQPPPTPD